VAKQQPSSSGNCYNSMRNIGLYPGKLLELRMHAVLQRLKLNVFWDRRGLTTKRIEFFPDCNQMALKFDGSSYDSV